MTRKRLIEIIKDPNIGVRVLLVLTVIGIMVIAILLSVPQTETAFPSESEKEATIVPTETDVKISRYNQGILPDYSKTTGLIVGTTAIMLIIELGTLFELYQFRKEK